MRKVLAMALAAALVLVLMPTAVLADGPTEVSTEAELLNARDAGSDIKLAADIPLSNKVMLDGKTLTIDLNGHSLTTPAVNGQYAISATVLEIVGNSNITIKGAGTVQSGTITNSTSTSRSQTIKVSGSASLTIENGAVIKGADAVNSRYGGDAIDFNSSGNLVITNSTVAGGNNTKDGNEDKGNHRNQGEGGRAIYLSNANGNVIITGSNVKGGDGLTRNYQTTYISGGENFATGGMAITSGKGATVRITDSYVKGGNSDLYNAADAAISAGGNTYIIEGSTVEGGDAQTQQAGNGYGIGGAAISVGNGVVTIESSKIIGGDGGDSWLGCGIQYKNTSGVLNVTNSIIIGGGVTGSGSGYGNAIYSNLRDVSYDEFSNINLTNSLLQLGADPSKVYSGSVLHTNKSGFNPERLVEVITDGAVTAMTDGSMLLGDPPTGISTYSQVAAKADIAYTIVITPSVDFGTIDRKMPTQTKTFTVAVEDALIEDEASITVENTTAEMLMRDKDGTGTETLAFTLEQPNGLFTFAQADLADGVESITSSVSCDPSELDAAGSYKGYMMFTVSYVTP